MLAEELGRVTRDGIDAALVPLRRPAGQARRHGAGRLAAEHGLLPPARRPGAARARREAAPLRRRVRRLVRLAVERHARCTTPTPSPSPTSSPADARTEQHTTRDGSDHNAHRRPDRPGPPLEAGESRARSSSSAVSATCSTPGTSPSTASSPRCSAPSSASTPGQSGLVATANLIGMAVGAVAWGTVADRIGRKKAFSITLLIFALFSVLGALSPNYRDVPRAALPRRRRPRRLHPGRLRDRQRVLAAEAAAAACSPRWTAGGRSAPRWPASRRRSLVPVAGQLALDARADGPARAAAVLGAPRRAGVADLPLADGPRGRGPRA